MRSLIFWDFIQRRMAVCYRGFGTTYWYHLHAPGPFCHRVDPGNSPLTQLANIKFSEYQWRPRCFLFNCVHIVPTAFICEPKPTHKLCAYLKVWSFTTLLCFCTPVPSYESLGIESWKTILLRILVTCLLTCFHTCILSRNHGINNLKIGPIGGTETSKTNY